MKESLRLMDVACDLCGGDRSRPILKVREFILGSGSSFSVARCAGCGHVFTNPRPRDKDLARFYPPSYWTAAVGRRDLETFKIGGERWRSVMARRSAFLLSRVARGRLLEIGSGDGLFLMFMREKGWEVEGIEPGKEAWRFATKSLGLNIRNRPIDRVDLESEAYDAVWIHHALEHLPSPTHVISLAVKSLRRGGLLGITVPNFDSFDRRVFGPGWIGLDVPVHLHHFTPRTLEGLLDRAGLAIEERRFVSNDHRWPMFYSDSLRRRLAYWGLYHPEPKTGAGDITGEDRTDMFDSGGALRRWAHHAEYGLFRGVGAVMDRIGCGSSLAVLARKTG
ncbi:MAG: class I SAM-dependent methyltransferase [Nitrospirae bacterium]|nr:class I SAM-dependent methyltransferase [Nitrospirota bacterium]